MKQQTYNVNGKEYSREQLLAFGKEHYPKLYWIPRVLGFIISFAALLILGGLGLVYLILEKAGAIDAEFPTWVFIIPTVVFGMFFLTARKTTTNTTTIKQNDRMKISAGILIAS